LESLWCPAIPGGTHSDDISWVTPVQEVQEDWMLQNFGVSEKRPKASNGFKVFDFDDFWVSRWT
jgi:hypothetical protein